MVTDGRLAFRTTICLNATPMQRDVNALCEKATGVVTEHGPVNLDKPAVKRRMELAASFTPQGTVSDFGKGLQCD
jgi:hypothetical protein